MWWHTSRKTRFLLSAKWTSPFKSAGGHHFSGLLSAEVCASAVLMLDTPYSEILWRVLVTHCICQFPLHFPSLRHSVPSHFSCTLQLSSPNIPTVSPQHKLPHYNTHTVPYLALTVCVSYIYRFVQPSNCLPVHWPVSYMC